MYPSEPTEMELLFERIKEGKENFEKAFVNEAINQHSIDEMIKGIRYYNNENDVTSRILYRYEDGERVVDDSKVNNKIPHNWHKVLVDQKVAYLVGNPINFSAEQDELVELINEHLGEEFDDVANELAKGSSNKGVEWLHPFINEDGEFDFLLTPAEQIIPFFQDDKKRKLSYIIRYYPTVLEDEATIRAELWDEERVWYFVKQNGSFIDDPMEEENPQYHFYWGTDAESQGFGWGRVPFIPFKNNEEMKHDLTYYKELIDAFDITVSDNQNSLEEIQDLIYILKGYEGTSLSEFMTNLKYYKAIAVDTEGGVDTTQAEVPMDSADRHLDRLRESIFTFGQGVDVGTDKFGNSPSGIALKFLYSLLDLKCDIMERKYRQGLQDFMWFLCEYFRHSQIGDYDYKSIDFTFRRSTMVNELEQSQIAQQSKGVISDETILSNHPWVDNLEQEKRRMADDRRAYGMSQGVMDDQDEEGLNDDEVV